MSQPRSSSSPVSEATSAPEPLDALGVDEAPRHAVAIVGVGAVLPDAPTAQAFWQNVREGRYSIRDVPDDRWRIADYYDPDPKAADKSYSKIGGWVHGFELDWRRFRLPPRVAESMDAGQQWALAAAAQALDDYGFPQRPLDTSRTGVIVGTAMGGQNHLDSHLRISYPEYERLLEQTAAFATLGADERDALRRQWRERVDAAFAPITEDTMPGELANVVSGRVANVLDLRGPNFITDAACASSLAAVTAATKLLLEHHCDAVLTGGVDHNMAASTFVKFCKVGALSARGSCPFGADADGFVMGEGCAMLLLRRLEDAERDGDRIYAVIRGIGVSSDGKGKGITAPNPLGQQLAIERAWQDAGLEPSTASLIEAHGTSTAVGDRVELETLAKAFGAAPAQSIALGSVKGNIGHLKAAAGAASLVKVAYALRERELPPTLHAEEPNRAIDFERAPYRLNHRLCAWEAPPGTVRRAAVSSYGFGGTNFHLVLEEHLPAHERAVRAEPVAGRAQVAAHRPTSLAAEPARPLRGILAVGASTRAELAAALERAARAADAGTVSRVDGPDPRALDALERVVIDFGDRAELRAKLARAVKAAASESDAPWRALAVQGICRGTGSSPGKLAFLFPGQGSQYLEMGRELVRRSPVAAGVLAEADAVMTPLLGRPLSSFLYLEAGDDEARRRAEAALTDTAVTQPAVISLDLAIHRLLVHHGFEPDLVMGHSLGEYAALVAAGAMPLAHALEATAARGREMSAVAVADKGRMAAVFAPHAMIERVIAEADGYVVMANINSTSQAVIGGETRAVEQAVARLGALGHQALLLPVSHAFHTRIVAAASGPLRKVLERLDVGVPRIPVVSNVTGARYPADKEAILALLEQQVATAVRWSDGLRTLYEEGARTFIEVGPKKALKGFVEDVLGADPSVRALFTNHPKIDDWTCFNQALCGLYAAGYGTQQAVRARAARSAELAATGARPGGEPRPVDQRSTVQLDAPPRAGAPMPPPRPAPSARTNEMTTPGTDALRDDEGTAMTTQEVSRLLAQALGALAQQGGAPGACCYDRSAEPAGSIVVTGVGLGLPGAEKAIMAPDNVERLLAGEQFIDLVPERMRRGIVDRRVTSLVKQSDGSGTFVPLAHESEAIKLAARPGSFDLEAEYDVSAELVGSLDITTQLAMAAGLDALREARIPLVQTYRATRKGKRLPDRWLLPEPLRDETGVVFASAFPGLDAFAGELERYKDHQSRLAQIETLETVRQASRDPAALAEVDRHLERLRHELATHRYEFDRRFLFRVLAMGHSQLAQYIGARGPNTSVNTACASAGTALALAEDWIRTGRCRRVLVVAADVTTSDRLLPWFGAGFQAAGAAATDDRVADAVLPFDRRRHGLVLGMGASALLLESEDAVRERGMRGIVELLGTETGNSAFHGTRLDLDHVAATLDALVTGSERRFGFHRHAMARETLFLSHETYTPARGGSAAAEVEALRRTFGRSAASVLIANTKGYTGHPLGVGIEAVAAVKMLEHATVPAVPNWREPDPELGPLNLSRGGHYAAEYAIVFSAGFGSQVAASLLRRIGGSPARIEREATYRAWLSDVSGQDAPVTAVHKRVLRLTPESASSRPPRPSAWVPGTGPARRVSSPAGHSTTSAPAAARIERPPWPSPRTEATREAPEAVAVDEGKARGAGPAPAPTFCASETLPPVSVTAAPAAGAEGADPIAARVIAIIAEKTGYPVDMLEPDLDLEADLGIDTVKQAETFARLRREFDIPPRDDLRLRDYPTVARVVEFVRAARPELPPSAPTERADATSSSTSRTVGVRADHRVEATESSRPPDAAVSNGPSSDDDAITAEVLAIVAAQTGYPVDMLEPDLDLEADLGIDTVKQAETFAQLRERFAIARRDDLRLRDYPTLRAIVRFVIESRAVAAPASVPSESPVATNAAPAAPTGPSSSEASDYRLEDADRLPRRVPVPRLLPPLAMVEASGVALGAAQRVVIAADQGGVGEALAEELRRRRATPLLLSAELDLATMFGRLEPWLAEGPIDGLYWLPALDAEPALEQMDLAAFKRESDRRVKWLAGLLRRLEAQAPKPPEFLVCGTRLGGLHGYGPGGASAPLGGAVTGFAKAYRREQPGMLVKAVDFGRPEPAGEVASILIDETLWDRSVCEVGYEQGARLTIGLEARPIASDAPRVELGPSSVILVTGAAGGLGSAIVADLARASGACFHLLDLAPEPRRDDADVALFRMDREALKRELIARARASSERTTPQAIERAVAAVERAAAVLDAIEAVEAAGGHARYHAVDLTDAQAVASVMERIAAEHDQLDVVLHAAGVEQSHRLADKSAAEFDRIYDVKADGLFNLLHAAGSLPIGTCLVFGSVAGRFGNEGQTDYSAANDLLCKMASTLGRRGIRGIAIDWSAWAAIGMASRGSMPAIMAKAGIELIEPKVGVPTVRRELGANPGEEIVVAGDLGRLGAGLGAEERLEPARAQAWLAAHRARLPLVARGAIARAREGVEIELALDPTVEPFLVDHQVEPGLSYLPGVMGLEAFAELAAVLCPARAVTAIEQIEFSRPLKFYRGAPRALRLRAQSEPARDGGWLLRTELVAAASARMAAQGDIALAERRYFEGLVRLGEAGGDGPRRVDVASLSDGRPSISAAQIYQTFFHGPCYRVLDRACLGENEAVGVLAAALPPDGAGEASAWCLAPRLLELGLQTAGIWLLERQGRLALPRSIDAVRIGDEAGLRAGRACLAVARALEGGERFDVDLVDAQGAVCLEIRGYRSIAVELPSVRSAPIDHPAVPSLSPG